MTRPRGGVLLTSAIALLLVALCGPAARSQETIEVDLGTLLLDDLQLLSPSSVYRPLDMSAVRAGARGWGMGGAYAASASGVEAVAWNPAGLGWLERADFAGDLAWVRSSGTTSDFPDTFNIPQVAVLNVTRYEVNLKARVRYSLFGAGTAIDLPGSTRLAGALSFRRYLDLSYPEEIVEDLSFQEAGSFPVTLAFDGKEKGGVDAAAATVALQVLPQTLSVGATLNVLDGRLSEDQEQIIATGGGDVPSGIRKLRFKYHGLSADFGIQARYQGLFSIGVRYTPRYTLEVTGGQWYSRSLAAPGFPTFVTRGKVAGYDMEVPSFVTVSGSVQPLPWLLVVAEVDRQKWGETVVEYRDVNEPNGELPLRNVTLVGLGAEVRLAHYRQIDLPLRVGYRQGPLSVSQLEPHGNPLLGNWQGGEIDSKALTLGVGVETGNVRYDLSYEFTDYKLRKFYFDVPFDQLVNPESTLITVDRRVAVLRLSASLSL